MSDVVLYLPDYASVRVIRCSPPSWMAHIALLEKGVEHRRVALDFAKGEHRTPAMLARNPRGTIPVLTDGDIAVHETLAILEYIEFAWPEPALLPAGRSARARALTRLHEAAALKDRGMALFVALMRAPEARDAAHLAELGQRFEAELDTWERALSRASEQPNPEQWVAGSALTLADLAVYTYVATAMQLGLTLDARPHLAAWTARMRARPSVQQSWPTTWDEAPPAVPAWSVSR